MIPPPAQFTLSQALEIARRRKWRALLLFAGALATISTLVVSLPDIYESKATLLVESQQVPESFVRSTVTGVERRLQGITETLMSRSRLNELIDRFGLYPELRNRLPLDDVIERMRKDVLVQLQAFTPQVAKGTVVAFTVTYRGRHAEKVAAVANELALRYVDEDLRMRERQAAGTAHFLENQLDEMKQKLDDQERKVRDFKERYLGALPQQETANLSTLERLNAQLLLNQQQQARVREELGQAGVSASSPDALAARLARAKTELFQLRQHYTDKYPDVVRLNTEIADLEKRLAEGEGNGPGNIDAVAPPKRGVEQPSGTVSTGGPEAELRGLKREESLIKSRIVEYQGRIESTPKREQEFQALDRDYNTTQEIYQALLKRYEEAKLAESLEGRQKGEQLRILDPAVVAKDSTLPNRPRLLLIGLLLSVGAALGGIVVSEMLDTSFHSVDELRSFSKTPVIATIQRILTDRDRERLRLRFRLGAVSAIAGLVVLVMASYVLARENTWLASLLS